MCEQQQVEFHALLLQTGTVQVATRQVDRVLVQSRVRNKGKAQKQCQANRRGREATRETKS